MQFVLISGPPGGPQAAVADALCDRFDRMLHIDVSVLTSFLRMGSVTSRDGESAALAQRRLFIESACGMAARFLAAGYGVVVSDVVFPHELSIYAATLAGDQHPAHFVVLCPPSPPIADALHPAAHEASDIYRRFEEWSGVATVETAGLRPDVIADRVMALASEGRMLLSARKQSP